jgi:putative copper resistance protein D
MNPEAALACVRFAHDAGLTLLWGSLGFTTAIDPGVRQPITRSLRIATSSSVGLVLVTTAMALPLQAAMITDVWSSVFDGTTLLLVAETHGGQVMAVQCATALLLAACYLAECARTTVILAGVMLCELAAVGHSSEGVGYEGVLRAAIEMVHVLSATAWLGALVPFILLVRMVSDEDLKRSSLAGLRRFSYWGHVAVALVVTTGIANTWFTVGGILRNLSSSYDLKLLSKIAAVSMMAAIAIFNRYVLVPVLRKPNAQSAKNLLLAGCVAEIVLGIVALGLVASFGLEDPS